MPSDDDFDDIEEFELTEELLKSLQDTEDRYTLTNASQFAAPPPKPAASKPAAPAPSRPAPARPIAPLPKRRAQGIDIDIDDTPDISISVDGTYSIQTPHRPVPPTSTNRAAAQPVSRAPIAQPTPRAGPSSASRTAPVTRTNNAPAASSSRTGAANQSSLKRTSSAAGLPQPTSSRVQAAESITSFSASVNLTDSMKALQVELQMMKAKQELMDQELRAAQDKQLTKEGEIANLRRTMDKQTSAHAEAIKKLRGEKADAEKQKAAVELEMKKEVDRLKTRLSFKQQEVETSLRGLNAPPSTVRRGKRIQMSQTPAPSRYGSFSQVPIRELGAASQALPATPVPRPRNQLASSSIDPIPFAGFHDSFARRPTSIVKSAIKDKGKGRAEDPPLVPESPIPAIQQFVASPQHASSDPVLPEDDIPHEDDAGMVDGEVEEEEESSQESIIILPTFKWTQHLYHLMFTCAPPVQPPSESQLALQIILSTSPVILLAEDTVRQLTRWQAACGELLGIFSAAGDEDDVENAILDPAENGNYQNLVKGTTSALLIILDILLVRSQNEKNAIYAVLYMIHALILMQPSFCESFLTTSEPVSVPHALAVVLKQYSPTVDPTLAPEDIMLSSVPLNDRLGITAISVLEALLWNCSDASSDKLLSFIQTPVLAQFLRSTPFWLVSRILRWFLLCTTRSQLVEAFVAPPEETMEGDHSSPRLIEKICEFLADPDVLRSQNQLADAPDEAKPFLPSLEEVWALAGVAMTILVSLSITRGMREQFLVQFPILPASLIACLAKAANFIWEDAELFSRAPPSSHKTILVVISSALRVLYDLYFPAPQSNDGDGEAQPPAIPASADLTHILTNFEPTHPNPAFHALDHTFIVTMARLGYADAPDWLGRQGIQVVDHVAEFARLLLEIFVGGPEADLIVEAYVPDAESDPSQAPHQSQSLGGSISAPVDGEAKSSGKGKGKETGADDDRMSVDQEEEEGEDDDDDGSETQPMDMDDE